MNKDLIIELINEVIYCLVFINSDVVGPTNMQVKTRATGERQSLAPEAAINFIISEYEGV